jgi:hypothetical protein
MRGVIVVLAVLGIAATANAQETKKVTAGPEYKASGTQRRWFGEGYRDVWTTPFNPPVLDLSKEAGGLEPVRQVGGLQTAGLALRGADGRAYTFRSLHKEPERLLPAEWRASWPAKLLRDATSATHPGAAVMLPVLAEAAGIPHTVPRLVVLPDDPKLGAFRATFANQVGTFEEYPMAGADGRPGFAGATEIISTAELWSRWLKVPEKHIDSRAFLRARILDLFVENYDRRRGQWRWMDIPGKTAWQPLPEDPDMAFVRHNGIVIASMRPRQPRLLEFSGRYADSLEGPTSNAAEVDRWLLADLEAPAYEELARELQAAWTDEVIDRAVAQLPEEWRALDKGFLAAALKERRSGLVPYVQRFYRYLAERVDVHLTNQNELVVISTGPDRATTVTVTAENASTPFFTRKFLPGETREVRVYLHGGVDQVQRTGSGPVQIRVIAAEGTKKVDSPDTRTEVWADADQVSGGKIARRDPWTNPAPVADGPWLEPRNFGTYTLWQPTAWYSSDLGVVLGISRSHTTYGFRSVPAAKEQTFSAAFAFGHMRGKVEYDGLFRRPASAAAFSFNAFGSGIEEINYFGLGNETPSQGKSRYRLGETVVSIAPAVRFEASRFFLTVGPELRYSDTGKKQGTILFEQAPYGIGQFGRAAVRASFEMDTRPHNGASVMALAAGAAPAEPVDQPPGRGMRLVASSYVAPSVWDVETTYGGVDGWVGAYAGGNNVQLAARVGGARVFGTYPWFDAAFLGGATNRGFHSHRFAGDASLYGNVELRTYLGGPMFQSVFPVRFGLVGFVDDGRVWLKGEDSQKWHPSGGGGVLLKPVGTSIVLRAVVADGGEGTLMFVGSGFRF